MRPEWITAIVAAGGAVAAIINVVVTLRMRLENSAAREKILSEVAAVYKREDVCRSDMATLRAECSR